MKTPFFFKGKHIGDFVTQHTFITYRDRIKHYMYKFEGYGISDQVLQRLKRLEVKTIIFRVKNDHDYKFKLNQYDNSLNIHVFNGDDVQKFVPIKEALM